jgi:hypothetical protein
MDQQLINWTVALTGLLGLAPRGALVKSAGAAFGKGLVGPRIMREQRLGSDEWMDGGVWAVVLSTNVAAVRFGDGLPSRGARARATLYVAFSSRNLAPTRVYKYYGVERHVAEAMFVAPSLGRFVHRRLKGYYPYAGPLSPSQV